MVVALLLFLGQAAPSTRVLPLAQEILVDGKLAEAAWSTQAGFQRLTMVVPEQGAAPSLETRVWVLADAHSLYIGIDCRDPDPAGIVAFSRTRDARLGEEDHIRIMISPLLDGRSGYVFAINPNGARYDALIVEAGEEENDNWDTFWRGKAQRGPLGWSAEIVIPVVGLNFKQGQQTCGLNVQRRIQRLQETDRWAGANQDYDFNQPAVAGTLTGLPEFDLGRGLFFRPTLVGGSSRSGPGERVTSELQPSFDLRKKLGAHLLGSLTVNTDFAEAEVDALRTNLTRFPLFFPEKRSFFLEGSDTYDFGAGLDSRVLPFHSRRIGLLARGEVPLVAGGKINGQIGNTNLGALLVRTDRVEGLAPAATMGAFRLKQNVLQESSAGLIATLGDPRGDADSLLLGADFTYRSSRFRDEKNLVAGVWGLGTNDRQGKGGTTATGANLSYPNDLWDWKLNLIRVGENFDPALGFVRRQGVVYYDFEIKYEPRPKWQLVRQMEYALEGSLVTDLEGEWESFEYQIKPLEWQLESGDRFQVEVGFEGENLREPFEIEDDLIIPAGSYNWPRLGFELELAAKRKLSAEIVWETGDFYEGSLDSYELDVAWHPAPLFILELAAEREEVALPQGNFTANQWEGRFLLNFSPDLTARALFQYEHEEDALGINARLRWSFRSAADLFVIYNHNYQDLSKNPSTQSNAMTVKFQYAFRR